MRARYLPGAVVLVAALGWPAGARAETMIDGGAVGGQVWTAAGSPYVVRGNEGNLTVPAGQELRLEAGTTVLFSDSAGPVLLQVEGTLTVNGTPAAPVTMRGALGGTAVAWQGIQSASTGSPQIKIAGALIQNASRGVSIGSGVARVDRTTFENCGYGISVNSKETYAFDSVVARNNAVGFECLYCGTVQLTNMVAQGNTTHGVVLYGAGAVTIVNSTLEANRNGVDIWPANGPSSVDLVNTVLSNHVAAIELDLRGGPAVLNVAHSTFWANWSANLWLKPSTGSDVLTAGTMAPAGTGNVVADPKYVSATDLHLTAGSACIDAGIATGAPEHDADQASRPVEGDGVPDTDGSTFDRGAYEFGATAGDAGGVGGESGAGGDAGGLGGSAGEAGGSASGAGGSASGGASGGNASGSNTSGGNASGGSASGNASGGNAMGDAGRGDGTVGGAGRSGGAGGAAGAPSGNAPKNDGCGCHLGASSDPRAGLALLALVVGLVRRRAQRKTR